MKRCGKQTVRLSEPVPFGSSACVAGRKEGNGPIGFSIDRVYTDSSLGQRSFEKAESLMQKDALELALAKGGYAETSLQYLLAGDLLGQCIGSIFGLREFSAPFLGLYGACSTMAQGLGLGAMIIDGGFAECVGILTSSHFCGSERQFRLPLEYGGQRTTTSQWTVTGAGAAILDRNARGSGIPRVSHVTFGKITDMGVKDVTYMGAAMAPAAYDTVSAHFHDCGASPGDYDLILTGDLGITGSDILRDLFAKNGVSLGDRYNDCGVMISRSWSVMRSRMTRSMREKPTRNWFCRSSPTERIRRLPRWSISSGSPTLWPRPFR